MVPTWIDPGVGEQDGQIPSWLLAQAHILVADEGDLGSLVPYVELHLVAS